MSEQERNTELSEGYIADPKEIRARAMQFFEGVDLSKRGDSKNGPIDIAVHNENYGMAMVNGMLVALVFQMPEQTIQEKGESLKDQVPYASSHKGAIAYYQLHGRRGASISVYEFLDSKPIVEIEPELDSYFQSGSEEDLINFEAMGINLNKEYIRRKKKEFKTS